VDDGTIEQWFYDYEKDITSFLIYFTGTNEVEDLVQDTFVIALRKLPMFKGNSQPKTWLISIARNLVIDRYRKPASNQIEEQTLKKIANSQLYDAILQLAPPFK
jgi:RNA polymerase sigma-70 factor (ECF subfamily)